MMRRNVLVEMRLIDDLVDLTRIGAGKLNLRMDPLDLHKPLNDAVALLQGDAQDKQLRLDLQCEAINSHIMGDAMRLQQICWNLIRNAIKFTPDGGCARVRTLNIEGTVCVEVSDNGIGIDPQRLTAIFEAFEQGDSQVADRFGGLGLGLAICQALTDAHGGTIRAVSAGLDQGATFTVCIPNLPEDVRPLPRQGSASATEDVIGS
jgi:signal transduction histidine kinase